MSLSQFQKNLNLSRYEAAKEFAAHYHKDDNYGGKPYFEHHLMGVSDLVRRAGYHIIYQTVAILHDVREDHYIPLDLLISKFGYDIAMAVDAISYRKGKETKAEYWLRCSKNQYSCVVKIYDAMFNKNSSYDECNEKRAKHYQKLEYLMKEYLADNFK